MGYKECVGRNAVCLQTAAGVESEPAKPEEACSHKDERDVMRDNWVSNTVILAFANHQRHDESRHTGVYVHSQ